MCEKAALILVDLQYDFFEGGALEVSNASEILPTVNYLINSIKAKGDIIIASQDWHPSNHISFAVNHTEKLPFESIVIHNGGTSTIQELWPVHCVQESHGAHIVEQIRLQDISYIVHKGTHQHVDSYSAFLDNDQSSKTPLSEILYENSIDTLIIVGLAADFCVKMTCLDAIRFGFKTILVKEGTQALEPNKLEDLYNEITEKGIRVVSIHDKDFVSRYL
ncbi:Isochorismatase-like protein [Spinellus fusiger]|nr:Isochorismatase-like protein [Spinellus fusiger]